MSVPNIDFSALTAMGAPHPYSCCPWCCQHARKPDFPHQCGHKLRPICGAKPGVMRGFWRCANDACFQRQLQYWILGQNEILFIPTPIQTELFEAVVPLDATGEVVQSPYGNILFGGSAGSSKSYGLRWLAHWLCLHFPHFQILMLRRTLPELERSQLKDIRREQTVLNATFVGQPKYELTYNATQSILTFGHCAEIADTAKYLSSMYDLIIFDEESTFEERKILDISTRARPSTCTPPNWKPIVVGGTNPGGISGNYCRAHYVHQMVDADKYPDYNPAEYLYIPSILENNPYYDTEAEGKKLKKNPVKYKAWRMADWDATEDQFFHEWRRTDERDEESGDMLKAHVMGLEEELMTQHTDRNVDVIERFCSMQFGLKQPGVVYWWAALRDGTFFIEDEFKFSNLLVSKVAQEIIRRNEKRRLMVRYVVCPDTMWNRMGHTGESLIETFRKSGLNAIKGHSDPVQGWNRIRALLDTTENGVPWVRFSATSCPYACQTLPALVGDPNRPDDLLRNPKQEDYAADAIRFGAMSRPYPTAVQSEWERVATMKGKAGAWHLEPDIPGYTAGGSMRRSRR